MNLVDELLKADTLKVTELKKETFKSHRLAHILGKKGTVEITLQEVKQRRLNDIASYQVKSNGEFDSSKTFDAQLMLCTEGIIEPNLRDKELQEHFGCKSAKDLCEKLFDAEVVLISDVIAGMNIVKDDEEMVKN